MAAPARAACGAKKGRAGGQVEVTVMQGRDASHRLLPLPGVAGGAKAAPPHRRRPCRRWAACRTPSKHDVHVHTWDKLCRLHLHTWTQQQGCQRRPAPHRDAATSPQPYPAFTRVHGGLVQGHSRLDVATMAMCGCIRLPLAAGVSVPCPHLGRPIIFIACPRRAG